MTDLKARKTEEKKAELERDLEAYNKIRHGLVTKERDHCATIKEDCATAKCCKITDYKCRAEGKGKGKCSKYNGKRQAMHSS